MQSSLPLIPGITTSVRIRWIAPSCLGANEDRIGTLGGFQHDVPVPFEDLPDQPPDLLRVLYHKDGFLPAGGRRTFRNRSCGSAAGSSIRGR